LQGEQIAAARRHSRHTILDDGLAGRRLRLQDAGVGVTLMLSVCVPRSERRRRPAEADNSEMPVWTNFLKPAHV
jgi:hypothetical protein